MVGGAGGSSGGVAPNEHCAESLAELSSCLHANHEIYLGKFLSLCRVALGLNAHATFIVPSMKVSDAMMHSKCTPWLQANNCQT
eukprot:6465018-Amphidinium_carterae.1